MSTSTIAQPQAQLPRLSLVINTFNAPRPLEKVLQAVLQQRVQPYEVLVADDGSGPETREVLESWKARLHCGLKHIWQPHEGFRRTHVLNKAVLQAAGDYLVFLDGDCVPHFEFVADHLLSALGVPKVYNSANPFDWMDLISVEGKTNFFEKRVGEYSKAGVGNKETTNIFSLDEDF